MKTSIQNEINEIQAELKLKAALGREYFSDEATALKKRLVELKSLG